MRVTSTFFISALIRRVERAGGFATVLHRGADEAGAVFVVVRRRNGEIRFFRPAPQALYDETAPPDRQFVADDRVDAGQLDTAMARELRFDPDLWLLELEPASGDGDDLLTIRTP